MHEAAMDFVRSALERVQIPHGPVLEIGGRNINGTVRPLFEAIGLYASLDLYDGPGVDIVADVCALDPQLTARALFGRRTVACVVCCEVLEHALNPAGICVWAFHVLAPGGLVLLTAANPDRVVHSGVDGGPLRDGEHYRGVSELMLRGWLEAFTGTQITVSGADIYAVAWKGRK